MPPRIAIVYYSMFGHIAALAEAEKRGVQSAGGIADLYQIPEILPENVLKKLSVPPRDPNVPVATPEVLANYDAFIFGIPTRFGSFPSQWAAFWERTSPQLKADAYWGKTAGVFTTCTSLQSGMETTAANFIPLFSQHGILFVPLGAKIQFAIGDVKTTKGGSPWGAGSYCNPDHSRFPTEVELQIAEVQGKEMAGAINSRVRVLSARLAEDRAWEVLQGSQVIRRHD